MSSESESIEVPALLDQPVPAPSPTKPRLSERAAALFEVLLCSDYPTQLAIAAILLLAGYSPLDADGQLQLGYVFALSIIDAAVLIGLIFLLLWIHGESPRQVLLGRRPIGREALVGLPLTLVAIAIGVGLLLAIQQLAPWLHNVAVNPLEGLIRSPRDAALFAVLTLVAGGFREEIQRAFILHRFEQSLGGPIVGIVISSIGFGAGHFLQGWDAMITTGLLGAFWGVIYLRRRSVAANVVSHAGFDLLEILQYFFLHH